MSYSTDITNVLRHLRNKDECATSSSRDVETERNCLLRDKRKHTNCGII